MRISWKAVDLTSPVGIFKVEYKPVLTSECVTTYPSVEYTVEVKNECLDAVITIDAADEIFK